MQSGYETSAIRLLVAVTVVGAAATAARYYYLWRRECRQLVRETEDFLASQPLPSK